MLGLQKAAKQARLGGAGIKQSTLSGSAVSALTTIGWASLEKATRQRRHIICATAVVAEPEGDSDS
jgi:hypothetical protein